MVSARRKRHFSFSPQLAPELRENMMGKVRWKRTDGEEEEEGEKTRVKEGGGFTNTLISLKNYISLVLYGSCTKNVIDKV